MHGQSKAGNVEKRRVQEGISNAKTGIVVCSRDAETVFVHVVVILHDLIKLERICKNIDEAKIFHVICGKAALTIQYYNYRASGASEENI